MADAIPPRNTAAAASSGAAQEYELVVRARRSTRLAMVVAAVIVVVFTVVALLLRHSATGVYFKTADQVSMVLLGLLLAAGALVFSRPRLRANAEAVWVRNIGPEKRVEWEWISGVSFPDGAAWARLELPDDEYLPVLAIQANDRLHAVDAVRKLRALGATYGAR